MAHPAARKQLSTIFKGALLRPLSPREKRAVQRDLRALLAWQTDLSVWQKPKDVVDALPYVAVYARGKLFGCFGAEGGTPGERLARAFLNALQDKRFGGLPDALRPDLSAEVSFVRRVTDVDPSRLESTFEPGTHGLGVMRPGGVIVLLPSVARDNGYKARGMFDAIVRKASLSNPLSEKFFSFEVDRVVARQGAPRRRKESARDAAARWLARLIEPDGTVVFALDARTGRAMPYGEMHHARVAAAVQALDAHGGHGAKVALARERLARDAREALSGVPVTAWPDHPAKVAGTLAHLVRAGVDVKAELLAMAVQEEVAHVPWHAAQVATALGPDAPESLVTACERDLVERPWAPWTVLASVRRRMSGDSLSRAVEALVDSIRKEGPHRGGVSRTEVPEVALTALTVEALRGVRQTGPVRAATARGEEFIRSWQVGCEDAPAAFDLDSAVGAFLGSPISSGLRADVTGHALLALS
jgi:AMMECR1 domain-containing protein